MRSSTLALVALYGAATTVKAALPEIHAVGNKFFSSNGEQFFMKGIAYQLTPDDPLVDTNQCKRDASLMEELGANVIRIYHVDPDADHDGCMTAFDDAGIYTLIDLDTFNTQILPDDPWWNQTQVDAFGAVMDTFHSYSNVLGFFVGNEVILTKNQSEAAPFVKAAARDLKAYRDNKGYREIPIGYSAADIRELRPMLQDYLTCGGNKSETIDFFALNSYSWCDPSDFTNSDYSDLQEQAEQFPVPIFFSETGCNVPGPRLFEDQAAIFGDEMVDTWSGSMVYEWIQERNDYGLISYGPEVDQTVAASNVEDGFTRSGTPTPVSPDFYNLQSQWETLSPTGVVESEYTPDVSTRDCPSPTDGWLVDGNVRLPSIGETFTGTFETSTSASDDGSAQATGTADDDDENVGNVSKEVTRTGILLGAVMMVFGFWL
ncbi:hypothetical protein MKZ38_000177 [Zalerion maritima]|uniref:1,3-beta-glucanosyltransferase n=1 Tax=Zalerion maritima TaxID=339359 RepID=A0AAD5RG97_9PEZI|nr:hypothetical protein MKZ38_000177 [Zalerion maritima]